MQKSSLLYKLNIRMLIIFLLVAISICILVSIEFYFTLKNEYISKGSAIAKSIADSSADFLVTKDISLIQDYINQYQKIEGINNIFLTNEKNYLIAHSFSPKPQDYVSHYIQSNPTKITFLKDDFLLLIRAPILNGSLGFVYIEMGLTLILKELLITILELIITVFVVGMIGLFFLSRFTFSILSPLNQLNLITQKMSQSDFQLSHDELNTLKSIQRLNNEIGSFSYVFENLYKKLQIYLKELTQITQKQAAIDQELAIAKNIQMNLLGTPQSVEITNNISVSTFIEPAKTIGGDFYDVYEKDNLLFITIGDVSGKGVSAALFMAATLTAIRSKINYQNDPSDIITEVNTQLCINNDNMLFVTVFFAVIDKTTLEMNYINAGHPSPFLISEDQNVTELPMTDGIVLGIDDTSFFHSKKILLQNNTYILMYTDGLTESQNTDLSLLGKEPVKQWCSQSVSSIEAFQQSLISNWNLFCKGIEKVDDCTTVILKISGMNTLITNPIKIHFQNDIQELIKLHHVLEIYCNQHNITKPILNSLNIVLEELISNTIYYGYEDHEDHLIYVTIEKNDALATIIVEDDGIPFNPLQDAPSIDLEADIEDRPVGGLGIHIVKNMVQSITYSRENHKNIITIVKEIT